MMFPTLCSRRPKFRICLTRSTTWATLTTLLPKPTVARSPSSKLCLPTRLEALLVKKKRFLCRFLLEASPSLDKCIQKVPTISPIALLVDIPKEFSKENALSVTNRTIKSLSSDTVRTREFPYGSYRIHGVQVGAYKEPSWYAEALIQCVQNG